MKKVIPKFRTEEQEARFWDTHSPLDYPGEFTEVKEPFEFTKLEALAAKEKGKEKPVTKKLINKLKNQEAGSRGRSPKCHPNVF